MNSKINISRYLYTAAAWIFVVGILTQVFMIGLSLLGGRPSWQIHIGLGHWLGIAPLLMVVLVYAGRLPRPMKPFTLLVFAIYVLLADVVIFMRGSAPIIAALHPVLAMLLFGVAGFLAIRAWRLVRDSAVPSALSHPTAMGD
ncbi:MAG: DUF6220 domain-containing protein [Anaerolineae bacterium]|nr:DUF6220 domain-containing protein [Anaerolineae bacterium]